MTCSKFWLQLLSIWRLVVCLNWWHVFSVPAVRSRHFGTLLWPCLGPTFWVPKDFRSCFFGPKKFWSWSIRSQDFSINFGFRTSAGSQRFRFQAYSVPKWFSVLIYPVPRFLYQYWVPDLSWVRTFSVPHTRSKNILWSHIFDPENVRSWFTRSQDSSINFVPRI